MNRRSFSLTALAGAVAVFAAATIAEAISIDLVTVGNPGNAPDTRYNSISVGSVPYAYQIGKYEVTAGQYMAFLNAVAATDPYGLYNLDMDYDAHPSARGGNIKRAGAAGSYAYSVAPQWADRPVNYVSWGDAARFTNWLHNGQPSGTLTGDPLQDAGLTEDGSYPLRGAITDVPLATVTRNSGSKFFIPSENEWHKAAYYDPNKDGSGVPGYWIYPTKSDSPPINALLSPDPGNRANFYDLFGTGNWWFTIGSPYWRTPVGAFANSASAYGTFDQGGNVFEWNATNVFGARGLRGGSFYDSSDSLGASLPRFSGAPTFETFDMGFRVAGIPEPGGITLLLAGAAAVVFWRLRRRWSKG